MHISLQKLLSKDPEASSLIETLLAALGSSVSVHDAAGNLLAGEELLPPGTRYPVTAGDEPVGWVAGGENASIMAELVTYVAERDLEKRALAREALDRYRELNLLYDVSEKVGASLEVDAVAGVAINEALRLIKHGSGAVLLLDESSGDLAPVRATAGLSIDGTGIRLGEGIIGAVTRNGHPEVVTDAASDPRRGAAEQGVCSLICAPLKAKQHVIGALVIYSSEPVEYTASDLKLLSAIASLAAPAIDNALLYLRTVRESQERERRLQQQLAELRIEVDRARQAQQVAQITGTDYFRALREQATSLRQELGAPREHGDHGLEI